MEMHGGGCGMCRLCRRAGKDSAALKFSYQVQGFTHL
jgi:hypothetical protein